MAMQFHNLNIGEGHIITVERANFTSKPTSSTADGVNNEDQDPDPEEEQVDVEVDSAVQSHTAASSLPAKEVQEMLYHILPAESEGGNYPLTLIRNAFHSTPPADTDHSAYFDDLEVSRHRYFPFTASSPR